MENLNYISVIKNYFSYTFIITVAEKNSVFNVR